ncbi:glycosyltransferase family 29 protein [Ideonella sp. 4Y11]|uniref:Glycosyltransferase family 29 protein n=1 Tax=Ideonella aquatica TaxID=2824119 RepID=A0A941BKI9_9BURK|nr:glycosyltransferase family 29 protein [Ideonella aquatica]MBQ0959953.1 glycosyltransferase family 29 protein [Ideonella aquatica]
MRCWASRILAALRRRQGRYHRSLLALANAQAVGGGHHLLAAAELRRDLGRPLPQRWVAPLVQGLAALPPARRARALGLLAEVVPALLPTLPAAVVDGAADLPPGAAEQLGRPQPLADAEARAAFLAWVQAQRAGGHALVGNAATLAGRRLGAQIDASAAVWRFNHWQGAGAHALDVGGRCDVWVLAPDVQDAPLPAGLRWAVVSGPDPRFRLTRWPLAERLRQAGVPVLTVPLPVWRSAVQSLQAPPSAGLLMLAWLGSLPGGWQGVSALGIGEGVAAGGRYHLAQPAARPGRRHDWSAEAALVARWRAQGLR